MSKFRKSSAGKQDGPEKKKDSYKSKRSFTKNKSSRESQRSRGGKREEFSRPRRDSSERSKGFDRPERREGSEKREFRPERKQPREGFREERPARKGFGRPDRREDSDKRELRPERSPRERDRDERPARKSFDRPDRRDDSDKRNFRPERKQQREGNRDERAPRREDREGRFEKRESKGSDFERDRGSRTGKPFKKPFRKSDDREEGSSRRVKYSDFEEGRSFEKQKTRDSKPQKKKESDDGLIRLNKYLSNAGIASRREADNLIQSGVVKVNGVVIDQLGYKIKPGDKVTYGDSAVKSERKVYLLLNKPKDYITTVDDPKERKTVMELIDGACRERVYPVGRLDRNTTGLLLFTNDGELTTKLTHPKFGVKKVYHVTLNKGLKVTDFKAIIDGLELEDGPVKVDDLAFVGEGKKELGVEIHSGRNRIVRRIFEHLGYDVIKLDRVVFAGLTKKDLPRGKYRFLSAKEIGFLQMIG